MKMKILALIMLGVLAILIPASCGGTSVLRVYNWGDYMDEEYVRDEFLKETGIRVKFQHYATNE
ncbi:MAG TPA: spermidine/putrescine ABC transporter substrate-binding protein, partial [Clostridiales bacterium]|nr:spermidine/putrescine ABC transporter substrate-binding protein [Clostridiales bacterium]